MCPFELGMVEVTLDNRDFCLGIFLKGDIDNFDYV